MLQQDVYTQAEKYTDFFATRHALDHAVSMSDVKSIAERFIQELETILDLIQLWKNDDHQQLYDWWEKQAEPCSQIALFVNNMLGTVASLCGDKSFDYEKNEEILLELLSNPPMYSHVYRSFLVLDDLSAVMRSIPDDCEIWTQDNNWSDSSGHKVTASCGKVTFVCYVPTEYIKD